MSFKEGSVSYRDYSEFFVQEIQFVLHVYLHVLLVGVAYCLLAGIGVLPHVAFLLRLSPHLLQDVSRSYLCWLLPWVYYDRG